VLIYPNLSQFALNPVGDMRGKKLSAQQQVSQIWEESEKEQQRFLANSPLRGKPPKFHLSYSYAHTTTHGRIPRVNIKLKEASEPLVPHLQNYHAFMSAMQVRLAEKAALVQEQSLAQNEIRQAIWDERLMKLSPASLYTFATSAWAGTDLDGMLDFILATQRYRQRLIDYFYDKNAFVSRLWFASDKGTVDWRDLAPIHLSASRCLGQRTALAARCAPPAPHQSGTVHGGIFAFHQN